jgi:hypothetical protein
LVRWWLSQVTEAGTGGSEEAPPPPPETARGAHASDAAGRNGKQQQKHGEQKQQQQQKGEAAPGVHFVAHMFLFCHDIVCAMQIRNNNYIVNIRFMNIYW